MPKIMGLQTSSTALAVRIVSAAATAAVVFFVFYYIPANISSLISGLLPESRSVPSGVVASLVGPTGLISPILPTIGLLLTVLVFLGMVLRGSKAYGILLIMNGLLFAAYTYVLLDGGVIRVILPAGLPQGASGSITIDASVLMLVLLIPSLLTLVKGVAVLAVRE